MMRHNPSRTYMAGPRTFPSHINDLPGINGAARAGLEAFDKPFLTIWGANDPGNLGQCATQSDLVCNVAGAANQGHVRLAEASHFLQDDQGEQIAERLVEFFNGTSRTAEFEAECEEPTPTLPVLSDGTGTPCASDDDCQGLTASKCLVVAPQSSGFCTVEGCEPSGCGDPYVCCGDCDPDLADLLPFQDSVCLPEAAADQLAVAAGCSCE